MPLATPYGPSVILPLLVSHNASRLHALCTLVNRILNITSMIGLNILQIVLVPNTNGRVSYRLLLLDFGLSQYKI